MFKVKVDAGFDKVSFFEREAMGLRIEGHDDISLRLCAVILFEECPDEAFFRNLNSNVWTVGQGAQRKAQREEFFRTFPKPEVGEWESPGMGNHVWRCSSLDFEEVKEFFLGVVAPAA